MKVMLAVSAVMIALIIAASVMPAVLAYNSCNWNRKLIYPERWYGDRKINEGYQRLQDGACRGSRAVESTWDSIVNFYKYGR